MATLIQEMNMLPNIIIRIHTLLSFWDSSLFLNWALRYSKNYKSSTLINVDNYRCHWSCMFLIRHHGFRNIHY